MTAPFVDRIRYRLFIECPTGRAVLAPCPPWRGGLADFAGPAVAAGPRPGQSSAGFRPADSK